MPLPQTLARSLGPPIPLSPPLPPTSRGLLKIGGTGGGGTLSWSLGMTMQPQTKSNWCWAATSYSVHHFYQPASTAWTQCLIANAELGQTSCCVNGATAQCNQGWFLDRALTRVGHLGVMTPATMAAATIGTELGGRRPVCCRIGWHGGGGHFVAIDGLALAGATVLTIIDPIYGTSSLTYATFETAYQGVGSWTHTYTTRP